MERPQFILFIEPARAEMPDAPTDEEIRIVGEHFNYLKAETEAKNAILVGRTQEPPYLGIAIFEADDAESARKFAENDPAIKAGVFVLKNLQSYRVALMRTV